MVDNLERIGEILGAVGSPGCFTARRTATADDLQLEVQGSDGSTFPSRGLRRRGSAGSPGPLAMDGGRRRFSTGESGTPGRFPGAG